MPIATEQPVPSLVITDPTTDAGRELLELHAKAQEATRILHSCQRAQRDSQVAVATAQQALASELDRGAEAGEQSVKTEVALVRTIEDCKIASDPALHAPRIATATRRQNEAVLTLNSHIARNVADLLEELRPEAERITAELTDARERLHPFLLARDEIVRKVQELTFSIHKGRMRAPSSRFADPDISHTRELWAVPTEEAAVPMPNPEVVAAWDRGMRPERYPTPILVADEPTEAVA